MARLNTSTTRAGLQEQACGMLYDACGDLATISLPVVGSAVQITTVAVSSASDNTDYTLSIGEDSSSLTAIVANSGTSATTTTIAAALVIAINATSGVNNLVHASSSGATITIRSRRAGESFTVSESDANLGTPSTTQSAAAATSIAFGLLVGQSTSPVGCEVLDSSDFTAKVYDVTPTAENSAVYFLQVRGDFDGNGIKSYTASFPADGSATVAEITAGLAAATFEPALPTSSVTVADATTKATVTGDLSGVDFQVTGWVSGATGGSGAIDVAVATANAKPAIAGVSRKAHTIEQDENGDAAFASGDTVSCLRQGRMWVRLDDSHTISALTDPIWVRLTAGASEKIGAFRSSADSTDCRPLSAFGFKGRWLSLNKSGFNGLTIAALEVSPL